MVDFFAGVGCFSIAGHAAGFETIAALEINQAAAGCYASHFPGVPNLGDIKTASPPTADLWTGGFPCVDVSPAGKRAGLDGAHSGLIWRFLDLAAALRPRWILLENSAGLITTARGQNAYRLFAALDDCGYVGCWRVMDARYFGVPQGRRRIFVLARDSGADGPSPEEVLFDAEGGSGDAATGGEEGAESAGGARGRPGISRAITTRPCQRNDPDASGISYVVGAFNADEMHGHGPVGRGSVARTLNTLGQGSVIGITPQAIDGPGAHLDMSPTIGTRNRPGVAGTILANYGDGSPRGDKGENLIPGQGAAGYFVRRFTPLECERIQGIPDNWTAGQSDARRYHQIGNACPPPMIEWILRRLASATTHPS